MPVKFETDQDSVFSLAFTLNINPKKMKKIEKEYMTMKSKEAEDEMEIRVKNILIYYTPYVSLRLTFYFLYPLFFNCKYVFKMYIPRGGGSSKCSQNCPSSTPFPIKALLFYVFNP